MNEIFAASAAVAWFGFLSSISPCTLAANLAAVTFAGRKVGPVRAAVLSGLLYSAGRTASCSLLGFGLVSGILNAPELSHLLQKYIEDSRALWEGHTDHLESTSVGGTIGTHVGPGAIAVFFFAAGE